MINKIVNAIYNALGVAGILWVIAVLFAAAGHAYMCAWLFVCGAVISMVEINADNSSKNISE